MNGVPFPRVAFFGADGRDWHDGWELVATIGAEYIGHVSETGQDEVTLDAYYSFAVQVQQLDPRGQQVRIAHLAQPADLLVSMPPLRIRWTRRRRVADFDDSDRDVLRNAITQAEEQRTQLKAARSNIQLASAIPSGVPGNRRG